MSSSSSSCAASPAARPHRLALEEVLAVALGVRGPGHTARSRAHGPDTAVHRTSARARDDDVVLPGDACRSWWSAGTFVSAIVLVALVGLASCAGGRHVSAGPTTVTTAAES